MGNQQQFNELKRVIAEKRSEFTTGRKAFSVMTTLGLKFQDRLQTIWKTAIAKFCSG